MDENKILDLSNLTKEHFESAKKAVYKCMGSGESGDFAFVTHKECERTMSALKQAFSTTFVKGAVCGAAALTTGYCAGYLIGMFIEHCKAKKLEKEFEEL